MNQTSLRRAIVAALVAGALATPLSGSAQDSQDTVVRELIVVAPASGPAWWKVSKGDASVWIFGLQPGIPLGMTWDQTTLKRRLAGARLLLGVYHEGARFDRNAEYPLLPPDLAAEYATLSARVSKRPSLRASSEGSAADRPPPPVLSQYSDQRAAAARIPAGRPRTPARRATGGPPTVEDLMRLRILYAVEDKIGEDVMRQINAIARKAKVPIVTPPVHEFTWEPAALAPDHPAANGCLRAVIAELNTPAERHREAAALWAKGDVVGMLEATPRTIEPECGYLWPGHSERTIAFQTSLIAQALDRPGKVVAVASISQLVRKDGILERLRAQGFTIHDPSKPLED